MATQRKLSLHDAPAPPEAQPPSGQVRAMRIIHPDLVLTLAEWQQLLNLPQHTLRREARLARLRTSRRAGRLWAKGSWIQQWIDEGEVRRRRPADGQGGCAATAI